MDDSWWSPSGRENGAWAMGTLSHTAMDGSLLVCIISSVDVPTANADASIFVPAPKPALVCVFPVAVNSVLIFKEAAVVPFIRHPRQRGEASAQGCKTRFAIVVYGPLIACQAVQQRKILFIV